MKYIFVDESWEDYLYWQQTDKKILRKINEILKDISRNPFSGLGKPEPHTLIMDHIDLKLGDHA